MVGADVDPAGVRGQVVDPVRDGLAQLAGRGSRGSSPATGSPFGRHCRPAFLYWPTSSFFLVSTLITGSPAAWMVLGLLVEVAELGVAVRVLGALDGLGVALQAEALLAQQVADGVGATPCALAGSARRPACRVDFVVHRSGDIGSPRSSGSTSASSAGRRPGSRSADRLAAPARPADPAQRLLARRPARRRPARRSPRAPRPPAPPHGYRHAPAPEPPPPSAAAAAARPDAGTPPRTSPPATAVSPPDGHTTPTTITTRSSALFLCSPYTLVFGGLLLLGAARHRCGPAPRAHAAPGRRCRRHTGRYGVAEPHRRRQQLPDRRRATHGSHRRRAGPGLRPPTTSAGLAGTDAADAGAALGLVNTFHQLGSALGLEHPVAVGASAVPAGAPPIGALVHRVDAALTGASVLLAFAMVQVFTLVAERRPSGCLWRAPARLTLINTADHVGKSPTRWLSGYAT